MIHKPKTIKEAIKDLRDFLEADLYTKFSPKIDLNGDVWFRTDYFKCESDFINYLRSHFNILEKQLKELIGEEYEK